MAPSAANPIATQDAASSARDRRSTAATYRAVASSQNARNGISDSKELPFTTNAGVTRKSSVASSGCGLNRRASDHALNAAISEKTIYAA